MKHVYRVQGMHCDNCVTKIEALLAAISGVTAVHVDLLAQTATVEMNQHISMTILNDALKATDYKLTTEAMLSTPPAAETKSSFKDFYPLIIIFSHIFAYTALALLFHGEWDNLFAMRHFEGAFFIIFGSFKLLNWKGFVDAYSTYDVVAKHSRAYAYVYPVLELGLGIAYLTSFYLLQTSFITLGLMVIGAVGVAQALANKKQIPCACLGVVFKIPMTTFSLIEDVLMAVMALLMILLLF